MKTREIEQLIEQIDDYKKAMQDLVGDFSISEKKMQLQRNLEASQFNSISKLINLIEKMQINGLWLMYKQLEKKERKMSDTGSA